MIEAIEDRLTGAADLAPADLGVDVDEIRGRGRRRRRTRTAAVGFATAVVVGSVALVAVPGSPTTGRPDTVPSHARESEELPPVQFVAGRYQTGVIQDGEEVEIWIGRDPDGSWYLSIGLFAQGVQPVARIGGSPAGGSVPPPGTTPGLDGATLSMSVMDQRTGRVVRGVIGGYVVADGATGVRLTDNGRPVPTKAAVSPDNPRILFWSADANIRPERNYTLSAVDKAGKVLARYDFSAQKWVNP